MMIWVCYILPCCDFMLHNVLLQTLLQQLEFLDLLLSCVCEYGLFGCEIVEETSLRLVPVLWSFILK